MKKVAKHLQFSRKWMLLILKIRPQKTPYFCVRWAMPTLLLISKDNGVIFGQALTC